MPTWADLSRRSPVTHRQPPTTVHPVQAMSLTCTVTAAVVWCTHRACTPHNPFPWAQLYGILLRTSQCTTGILTTTHRSRELRLCTPHRLIWRWCGLCLGSFRYQASHTYHAGQQRTSDNKSTQRVEQHHTCWPVRERRVLGCKHGTAPGVITPVFCSLLIRVGATLYFAPCTYLPVLPASHATSCRWLLMHSC